MSTEGCSVLCSPSVSFFPLFLLSLLLQCLQHAPGAPAAVRSSYFTSLWHQLHLSTTESSASSDALRPQWTSFTVSCYLWTNKSPPRVCQSVIRPNQVGSEAAGGDRRLLLWCGVFVFSQLCYSSWSTESPRNVSEDSRSDEIRCNIISQ